MDKLDSILPPELFSTIEEFYRGAGPDAAFADRLGAQLRQRQLELVLEEMKKRPVEPFARRNLMHTLRTRPILAILAVLLALILLTGVVYAVGRLAGFIPGIGFVEGVHSVLETPVSISRTAAQETAGSELSVEIAEGTQDRAGITVTVEKAAAEAEALAIVYKIAGLPVHYFNLERSETLSETVNDAFPLEEVRLADGTFLPYKTGGGCEGAGDLASSWITCRIFFAALPEGTTEFTLIIHRLWDALPGELPEEWEIPVRLAPVSPGHAETSLQTPGVRSQTIAGVTLELVKASQSSSNTAFQLGVEWQGERLTLHHSAPVKLRDGQGRYYVLSGGPDAGSYSSERPNFSTISSQVTSPVDGSSPLTIGVDWIMMTVSDEIDLRFDPGTDPQVGQEWNLDQDVRVGDFELHFSKARLKEGQDGNKMLEFDIQAPANVTAVYLPGDGFQGESGYDIERGVLVARSAMTEIPGGSITFDRAEVTYRIDGPFEILWQPERLDSTALQTPTPAPTRVAVQDEVDTVGDPLLAEVQTLLQRGYAEALYQAGWVHQKIEMEQSLPSGQLDYGDLPEQPAAFSLDIWSLLDENGFVVTSVSIQRKPDGTFLSANIDNGVYHFSLPDGWGSLGNDIYLSRPAFDQGALSVMNSYLEEGGSMGRMESTVDGIACQAYTATRTFDPPATFYGQTTAVQAWLYSACIDPNNGQVLQIQQRTLFVDGTSRVTNTMRLLALERVEDLPPEVQELLNQVVMP